MSYLIVSGSSGLENQLVIVKESWVGDPSKIKLGDPVMCYYNKNLKVEITRDLTMADYLKDFNGISDKLYKFYIQAVCGNYFFSNY